MKKMAILFPGQGCQFVGMGRMLYTQYQYIKEYYQEANDILGFDIKKLCFEGNDIELTKTENLQPAILLVSYAAYKFYEKEVDVEPSIMAGHSLGELTALTCSGVLSFENALKIVRKRGELMQEAMDNNEGAMAALIGVEKARIEQICSEISEEGKIVTISNYNSNNQLVISGYKDSVMKVSDILKDENIKVIMLKVSAPFHCELMKPVAEKLRIEIEKYPINEFKYQIVSNVSARSYEGKSSVIDNLVAQVVSPVKWSDTILFLQEKGIETAIELGPKSVLSKFVKDTSSKIETFFVKDERDVNFVKENIYKDEELRSDTNESKMKLISRCLAIAVCTKNLNINGEEYQEGVVKPYKKIKNMYETLENSNVFPTDEQMKESLLMLISVFKTKMTSEKEQKERFDQLKKETGMDELINNL